MYYNIDMLENLDANSLDTIVISKEKYNEYVSFVCWRNIKESLLTRGLHKILMFGAKKYSPDSWKTHEKDFFAACIRHLGAVKEQLDSTDKESGLLHLDHAICNLMFLRYQVVQKHTIEASRGQI